MRIPTDRSREAALPLLAQLRAGRLAIGLTVALLLPSMAEAQKSAKMAGPRPWGASGVIYLATGASTTAAERDALVDLPYGVGPALEIAPLLAGERRVVEVPPGSLVQLDDPVFDPAVATFTVSGNDLEVTAENGGVLVLVAFFGPADLSPLLSVMGGPATPADELLARAEATDRLDERTRAETLSDIVVSPSVRQEAAGAGERAAIAAQFRARALRLPDAKVSPAARQEAAGGGELAAIVPIVGWLLSRLDSGGSAEAAELGEPPSVEGFPILDQVLAQLRIAIANDRLEFLDLHLASLGSLEKLARQIEAADRSGNDEVQAVQIAVLEARLAREDAKLELDLAIDDHLDRFRYRLTSVSYPEWPSDPPRGLSDLGREVAETYYVEAARQFRHLGHARESLALVDELLPLIAQWRDLTEEKFEVGLATVDDMLAPQTTHLAAVLRFIELRHAEIRAEAWLLAVMGELTDDVVVRQRQQ